MAAKQASTLKTKPTVAVKLGGKPATESVAAKRQRLHTMLRDLQRDAEEMSANADKLLERFS